MRKDIKKAKQQKIRKMRCELCHAAYEGKSVVLTKKLPARKGGLIMEKVSVCDNCKKEHGIFLDSLNPNSPQAKIDAMNEIPIGTEVVYWPLLMKHIHNYGKRTRIRSIAFLADYKTPVVYLEGFTEQINLDCVEIGSLMDLDSPCFDQEFQHLW